jgi:L-aminopeptidase/D-esterase-like protein
MARTGALAGNGSGDLFLAFSTANPGAARPPGSVAHLEALSNMQMDGLLFAAAYATEEAIINCLVAAETMRGFKGQYVAALPKDRLAAIFRPTRQA